MYVHQYVQHDWSPLAWALMLAGLAVAVFTVMALFLLFATRSYGADSASPPADAGATEPQSAEPTAPVAPPGARIAGHP
jgi:hypothetical protein